MSKLVVLLTMTDWLPDENVTDGHLPLSPDTTASNSMGVPVVGEGTGVGSGPVDEPSFVVTVTDVEQTAVARVASVAVQSTGVVPTANVVPDAGEQVVETGAMPPVTFGLSKVTCTEVPLLATVDGIIGHVIPSGMLDTTTTLEQEACKLAASVAVQDSGVVPTGNIEPELGEHVDVTGAVPPATIAENVTATGSPVYEVAVGTGQAIVGAPVTLVLPGRPDTSGDGRLIRPAASYAWTTK